MRVVFVVLDAFPNSVIDPDRTPTLHRLATDGGRNQAGGVAQATAATYPNHASFVTGVPTLDHGIITNSVLQGRDWVPAQEVGPAAPTLFDACRAEGRRTAAVVGDQNLIGVCGAAQADDHWPPNGRIPHRAKRGEGGYLADAEVIGATSGLNLDALDFLFVQLDEVDGVRHIHGAWSDEALAQCTKTDAALGKLVDLLQPSWEDTVLFVVSDHDHEDVGRSGPIDFRRDLPGGATVNYQGTAALVVGRMDRARLEALPGVVGAASLDDRHHVVWGQPGQTFGVGSGTRAKGDHGSPRTATQVAVVSGGHPTAKKLAETVEQKRPAATDWATWAADCLELSWRPGAPAAADDPAMAER